MHMPPYLKRLIRIVLLSSRYRPERCHSPLPHQTTPLSKSSHNAKKICVELLAYFKHTRRETTQDKTNPARTYPNHDTYTLLSCLCCVFSPKSKCPSSKQTSQCTKLQFKTFSEEETKKKSQKETVEQ
jgi:hypothetical protein